MRLHERVRVFYPNKASQESAAIVLNILSTSMSYVAKAAKKKIRKNMWKKTGGKGGIRSEMLMARKNITVTIASQRCHMNVPKVYLIDDYVKSQGVYGLDIPGRLFWEGRVSLLFVTYCTCVANMQDTADSWTLIIFIYIRYIAPNDITRPKRSKYETGRPSMPKFQQKMNIDTLRHWEPCDTDPGPRPVLWHGDCGRIGEDAPE